MKKPLLTKYIEQDEKTGQKSICCGIMKNEQQYYLVTKAKFDYILIQATVQGPVGTRKNPRITMKEWCKEI